MLTSDDVARHLGLLDGVRRSRPGGRDRWTYCGRLVARLLDDSHLAIRTGFAERDALCEAAPATFSVPSAMSAHMTVVADLVGGDRRAIEDALDAAWLLQRDLGDGRLEPPRRPA